MMEHSSTGNADTPWTARKVYHCVACERQDGNHSWNIYGASGKQLRIHYADEPTAKLIVEAVNAHAQQTQWQPIETAPKNHLPILAYGPYGPLVAFKDVSWNWWPFPATEPLEYIPSHWMPLPNRRPALPSTERSPDPASEERSNG